jgi:orotidine 5'-phosphate decarboxylase subfamily 2
MPKHETGFAKIQRLKQAKHSSIVLGIDIATIDNCIRQGFGSQYEYFKYLISNAEPFIIGIKINLAFYEGDESSRNTIKSIMRFAGQLGLAKILDVKRGDIANTQSQWAKADISNFEPDCVTLNPYVGVDDVVTPYLQLDPRLCVYVLAATSNANASQIQDQSCNGLPLYSNLVLAHQYDSSRVGWVIGSTKIQAIQDIRRTENQYNYPNTHILAPGYGRQGGDLDFAKFAGDNAVYPISSGLTDPKYLQGKTTAQAAKDWRDAINAQQAQAVYLGNLTDYAIDALIQQGFVKFAKSNDLVADGFLLKRGKTKLMDANIDLPKDPISRNALLHQLIDSGTLSYDQDFADIFVNLRDLMGMHNINARNVINHLYIKSIRDSKVKFDAIGAVPYGALFPAICAANSMSTPFLTKRKESDLTHNTLLGGDINGKTVIVVEDVITSGGSVIDFVKTLRDAGATVQDVFVFLDRQQGARDNLQQHGLQLSSVIDMDYLKDILAIKQAKLSNIQ